MELTTKSITKHSTLLPGIEGYRTLIEKIEENKSIHPDIAIESCKSLIEGLCLKGLSLLSDKYNGSLSLRKKCKNDLTILTNTAFDEVYTDYVESQVHESLSKVLIDLAVANKVKENAKRKIRELTVETVAKVSAIRNERGDISHGRDYPKSQESSIALSKSICSITDGICSFMIEQIAEKYRIKVDTENRLDYEKLYKFNDWLDEMHNVSNIKIDFSKMLYDSAYEKYEEYYYIEYVESEEYEEDELVEGSDSTIESENLNDKPSRQEEEKVTTAFDEDVFWNESNSALLQEFASKNYIHEEKLKAIINEYFFTEKEPLKDSIAKSLIQKPTLSELKNKVPKIKDKVMKFIEKLNKQCS